jgi:hypothetical protein
MGVVLAGMLHVTDVTADQRFQAYAIRTFDFIFDHLDYYRRQAAAFGPQPAGYRRLVDMRELDDCGAIGAALVRAYAKKSDPRCRRTIDVVADFITAKMMRLPDGTLARPRPQPVANVPPSSPAVYYAGFAWDRGGMLASSRIGTGSWNCSRGESRRRSRSGVNRGRSE